jgi:hypothetical protein
VTGVRGKVIRGREAWLTAELVEVGSFAAPDGKLVFDFDETIPGPREWDVKRMATSLVLASRESGHGHAPCKTAAEAFVSSYCRAIDAFSRPPILQVARHQVHREERIAPIHAALLQSERERPLDLLKKFTEPCRRRPRHSGESHPRHFRNKPPLLRRIRGKDAALFSPRSSLISIPSPPAATGAFKVVGASTWVSPSSLIASDIEACLRSVGGKLCHMGFRGKVARSNLADANESRDWRIFADFAQVLIAVARPLYADEPIGVERMRAVNADRRSSPLWRRRSPQTSDTR